MGEIWCNELQYCLKNSLNIQEILHKEFFYNFSISEERHKFLSNWYCFKHVFVLFQEWWKIDIWLIKRSPPSRLTLCAEESSKIFYIIQTRRVLLNFGLIGTIRCLHLFALWLFHYLCLFFIVFNGIENVN